MNNTIQYKGYIGSAEFSEEDSVFFGKVLGIRSLISYEGENAKELIEDFHPGLFSYASISDIPANHLTVRIKFACDIQKKYFDTHIYSETKHEARRRKKNYAPPFYLWRK